MYHNPVMLKESIEGLLLREDGIYADATFGGGGHSREILMNMKGGRLFSFDRDPDALTNTIDDSRFMMINADYRFIKNYLRLHDAIPCDGILADLGISSHQIDAPERGFSTRYEGALDMRMDSRTPRSAADVVNNYPEEELSRIFRDYGEIRHAGRLAGAIMDARGEHPIESTAGFRDIVVKLAPRGQESKFLAQVFQAIRIEVNHELRSLEEFLVRSLEVLRPGGRMVVISYHSLEDRLVKNFFHSGNVAGRQEQDFYGNVRSGIKAITKKPVVAGPQELKVNPRARSAKLRIGEKV